MSLPRIAETAFVHSEPELRFTPGGKAVLNVPLLFKKSRKNPDTGEWEDQGKLFARGTLWGDRAEAAADEISKGSDVIVIGEIEQRDYERKDGSKGLSIEVRIFEIAAKPGKKAGRASRDGFGSDPWGAPAADEKPF